MTGSLLAILGLSLFTLGYKIYSKYLAKEIYSIDRKASENREVVEFELAAPTDLAGVRIPGRQATRSIFPSIGTFVG